MAQSRKHGVVPFLLRNHRLYTFLYENFVDTIYRYRYNYFIKFLYRKVNTKHLDRSVLKTIMEGDVVELIAHIASGGTAIALLCSGYSDYKTRVVPNIYPFIILLLGFFTGGVWLDKFLGLILPFFLAVFLSQLTKQASGGADLKLYAALGFNLGLSGFCICLFLSLLIIFIVSILARLSFQRSVPLYTYIALAYFIFELLKIH